MDLELLDFGNELLKREPKTFRFADDNAKEICDKLFARMKELGGIGLSANQVGLDYRIFVFGDGDALTRYIINPTIIAIGEETESMKEGCLSLPGVFLMVRRPTEVTLQYFDTDGNAVVEQFKDLAARVVLHEYDHMIGQNFTQRVSRMKLDRAIKAMKKKVTKKVRADVRQQLETTNV
jgi:peptide deformylase